MTKKEAIAIIQKNKYKPINEIKRIIKRKMPIEQRTKFTSEHLFQLITEMNQLDQKEKASVKKKGARSRKEIEGEERWKWIIKI